MPDLVVWTTIACLKNPGPGAYAFRTDRQGRPPLQAAFGRRRTTTNRMQLFAVIAALAHINRQDPQGPLEILIRSFSRYVTDNLHQAPGMAESRTTNGDLWEQLARETGKHRVETEWVKTRTAVELVELQELAAGALGQPHRPTRDTRVRNDDTRPLTTPETGAPPSN